MQSIRHAIRDVLARTLNIHVYRRSPRGADLFTDMARLLPNVKPKTILDVGANLGLWAVDAHRRYPEAQIFCFEPAPNTFLQLKELHRRNTNIQCINTAVGDIEGSVVFQIDDHCDRSRIVDAQGESPDEQLTSVPVTTLDKFFTTTSLSAIDILKIDVEGYDMRVLMGAKEILTAAAAKLVYVEAGFLDPPDVQVPFFELHAEITKYGYALFGFYEQVHEWKTKSPKLRRVNAAYINPQLAERLNS